MMPLRKALLGAALALPLAGLVTAAHAKPMRPERVIHVPAGSVVLIFPAASPQVVPPAAVMPMAFPMLRIMQAQDAMMQQMLRQVRALDQWSMSLPDPGEIMHAATTGISGQELAPGTSVVTTMVSNGHGVCRETVTYRMPPDGTRPQVHVVRTGDDCASLQVQSPVRVNQTGPAQRLETTPALAPQQPPLWTVGDPPQRIRPGMPRS